MAIVIGTSAGFLAASPVGDPGGTFGTSIDTRMSGQRDTSPATAGKVTEIGWYCSNAVESVNIEVGIYSDDAVNTEPQSLLGSAEFSKGTTT